MISVFFTALGATLAAPLAIENVTVEVGDGTVLNRVTVVIDNGRITAVGPGSAPAGATRLDGSDKVLAPGFIESTSQLGLVEVGLEDGTVDDHLEDQVLSPAFRAADGLNVLSVRLAISREEGVTSTVVAPRGGVISGTGYWLDLVPALERRPDPTRPLAMFGAIGHSAIAEAGGARGGLWLTLRQLIEDTRFFTRNRSAIDRGESRPLVASPLHLEAFVPVVEGRLPLVLEADRATDILAALELAAAYKLRLVIGRGAEAWRVADALAKAKVPVILQPSMQTPWSFETLLARDDAAARLHQAGVPLLISSGDSDQNLRRLRQEAGIAVANGLPHAEAVRAITSRPAEVFGKLAELGTVSVGKRANLVLWSGDVLELSSVAERVFIDGVELPQDNRQRRLVERYMKRE